MLRWKERYLGRDVQLLLQDTANILEPGFVVDVVVVTGRHLVSLKIFSWYVRPFFGVCVRN